MFTLKDVLGEFADAHYYGKGPKTLDDCCFIAKQSKVLRDRLSLLKRLAWVPGAWEAHKARNRRSQAKWRAKPASKELKRVYMIEYYSRPGTLEANRERMRQRKKCPIKKAKAAAYKRMKRRQLREAESMGLTCVASSAQ